MWIEMPVGIRCVYPGAIVSGTSTQARRSIPAAPALAYAGSRSRTRSSRTRRSIVGCTLSRFRTDSRLGRYPLERYSGEIGTLRCMLDRNRADIAIGIDVRKRVFIEIAGFRDLRVTKFDRQCVRVTKVADSHGRNRRSKNAL